MKVYSRGGVGVYADYRENIVVSPDHPILRWKANKERFSPSLFPPGVRGDFPGGLPRIGSENSEDALSWNLFCSLQLSGKIRLFTDMVASRIGVDAVYFWGRDQGIYSEEMDPVVQQVLDEMEPWGRGGVRQQTETDVILRGKARIIMVESKLGKPGARVKAWSRSTPGMRPEYQTFMTNLAINPFNDCFNYERDGNRCYQLFRNYLLGARLAAKCNAGFSLVAIVNSQNSNLRGKSHEAEFAYFQSLLIEPSNILLITWQQLWHSLQKEAGLEPLLHWLRAHPLLGLS